MRYFILLCPLLLSLFSCVDNGEEGKNAGFADSSLTYYYIYDQASAERKPVDSILMVKGDYENSLPLYKNVDSLSKFVSTLFAFNIATLESERFAVITDSITRVYQWKGESYQRLFELPNFSVGIQVQLSKKDINGDGYQDLVLQSASGGTHGDDYAIFFYHPEKNTLVVDPKVELSNIEIDTENKIVISNGIYSSLTYEIDNYTFRLVEQSSSISDGEKTKIVTTNFDSTGHVVARDTVIEEEERP